MNKQNSNQFSIQFIFIMLLFLIIVILSVMIIVLGKNVYNNINDDRASNYELRVSLSYIANKIRQADKKGAVDIKDFNGNPAVVIKETYDDFNYETWIYYFDNCLYEILIDEGSTFDSTDGMKILDVDSFNILKLKGNMYKFSAKSSLNSAELVLSMYSDQ